MKHLNHALIGLVLTSLHAAFAVEVHESTSSMNAVVIMLSADEVDLVRGSYDNAQMVGREAALKVLQLAGVPESVSGKVAYLTVWGVLLNKYASDFQRYAKQTPRGNNLMLKYYGVNLQALRETWQASEIADEYLPGSELTKQIVGVVNEIANKLIAGSLK